MSSFVYWVLNSVSFLWILFHQLLNWAGQAASGWVEIINLTMTKWLLVYWNIVKLSLSVTTRKVTCKTTFCYRQCRKHCSSFRLYWRDSRLNCEISALDQLLVSSELYVLYLLIVEICVELNLGWKVELVIVLSRHIVDELPTFANNFCLLTLSSLLKFTVPDRATSRNQWFLWFRVIDCSVWITGTHWFEMSYSAYWSRI